MNKKVMPFFAAAFVLGTGVAHKPLKTTVESSDFSKLNRVKR